MGFDWKAFEEGKLAYNARTEEDAKAFLAECEKRGMVWLSGSNLSADSLWRIYEQGTCYVCGVHEPMRLEYCDCEYYFIKGLAVCLEPWKQERAMEVLRREHLGRCELCRYLNETKDVCPSVTCDEMWGKLADRVEAEIEEAKQARCCAYIDELASIGRLPKRNQGEPLEKYLNRTHVVLPRWEDGSTVSEGDPYGDTTVAHIAVYSDGDWCINMADDSQVEGTLTQTVERIEPDTQERIDEDATLPPSGYIVKYGIPMDGPIDTERDTKAMISHLLERQRKLDAKAGER